jgi:hypothetical protein
MAANVELPGVKEVIRRVARGGRYLREDAPFHTYFSDAKYDAIGTIPRERLKATSFKSTPVLWKEPLVGGMKRKSGSAFLPLLESLRRSVCRSTARTHSSLRYVV